MEISFKQAMHGLRLLFGIVGLTALAVLTSLSTSGFIDALTTSPLLRQVLLCIAAGCVAVPLSQPMMRWVDGRPSVSRQP